MAPGRHVAEPSAGAGSTPRRSRAPGVAASPDLGAPKASARGLTKVYGQGDTMVRALDGVDVDFHAPHLTAIMGPSGSGKSTLMHCMAGLDTPTAGSIVVDGLEVSSMSQAPADRAAPHPDRLRVPVLQPRADAHGRGEHHPAARHRAHARRPGVVRRGGRAPSGSATACIHRPSELSGGQQQRVACARALVSRPSVVFADEPTGNLDSRSSGEVLAFLRRSVDELGQTVVMVTHDPRAASFAHRVLFLADGRMVGDIARPEPAGHPRRAGRRMH